jgi:hypothetical protein
MHAMHIDFTPEEWVEIEKAKNYLGVSWREYQLELAAIINLSHSRDQEKTNKKEV